ncbi:uridine phosphorylase 1-like [Ruditapes philippinarum]|uniref:uridine phosphorylase 1-like n=1 Tax=Ruditapes philippinarum TaxID=129788 RepID=UPI00295B191B|nr:uridine phosphorylase 1-like [Ruditapes philippinarum]XP_060551591.1 uridine phosphorylase 1-like [Ruditapes philippinarum]XP_060551592.1 uridine phosphorylase 1-like [Ruditapes philippinarum]
MDALKEQNQDAKLITGNREVRLNNENLKRLTEDHLYHIALSNVQHDLRQLFGDVKFVCFGGQSSRMEKFASFISKELGLEDNGPPKNYAGNTDRYAVYKAGPVLSVSHGIGIPSLSIIFQEIVKLVYYAGCRDVTFFRIGTSGGLGLEPGTVVVSERVVNGALEPSYKMVVLGKTIDRPAVVDTTLVEDLANCSLNSDNFKTVKGTTLCADDFYEGQGRVDGAFCEHEDGEKFSWLRKLKDNGVTNMEMESLGFIAMCHRANIKGAVCCVTLLDRFEGDGLTTNRQLLSEWQTFPQIIVSRYIQQKLNESS